MKLCDALIKLRLFSFFFFLIYNTHGHEHHNQIDPVTAKYSQPTINVDPLSKHIEANTIQNNNFQQLNDDENLQDTIDARLQAKHNLRQSVHQDNENDNNDNEEEYINKLNSALEKESASESQFQHEPTPIKDPIQNTPSQNPISDEVPVVSRIINESRSSPTPIQTPNQQRQQQQPISDELSSTQASPTIDPSIHTKHSDAGNLNSKPISDKVEPPVQAQTNEQKPTNIVREKVVEEILISTKQTVSSTPSLPVKEPVNVVKPITNQTQPSTQQQQQAANIVTDNKAEENKLVDATTSTAPVQPDPSQAIKSDTIKSTNSLDTKSIPNERSSDIDLNQLKPLSDSIKLVDSSDIKPDHKQAILNDPSPNVNLKVQLPPSPEKTQHVDQRQAIPNDPTVDLASKPPQASDRVQSTGPSDVKPDHQDLEQNNLHVKGPQTLETVKIVDSPDPKLAIQQPAPNNDFVDINAKQQVAENVASPNVDLKQQQKIVSDTRENVDSFSAKTNRQEPISNDPSLDLNLRQQQTSDKVQNVTPLDNDIPSVTIIKDHQKEPMQDTKNILSPSNIEQLSPETKEHINTLDEKVHNTPPTDQTTPSIPIKENPEVISATKPTETVARTIKPDENLSERKDSSTTAQTTTATATTTARILRSATARMAQAAQARARQGHVNQEPTKQPEEPVKNIKLQESTIESTLPPNVIPDNEPTVSSTTMTIVESTVAPNVKTTIEPTLSSTTMTIVESTVAPNVKTNIESTLSSTITPNLESTVDPQVLSNMEFTTISNVESTILPTSTESIKEHSHSIESSSTKPEEPYIETTPEPVLDLNINDEIPTEINKQNKKLINTDDLPRQVHVHDPQAILDQLNQESNETENQLSDHDTRSSTTVASVLANDHSPHLPRIIIDEEITTTTDSSNIETLTNNIDTIDNRNEKSQPFIHGESKVDETNNSLKSNSISNNSEKTILMKDRQVCWYLPKSFEPSMELVENKMLRLIDLLPDFLQATLFGRINDREKIMNTIWFGSLCTMCLFFSFIFLGMGTKRLKRNKEEKTFRARCQQLQQYNNQIELERATFEKQNQELSDQIDELKKTPVSDADEELFELREKYERLHAEWKTARTELDGLQNDNDYKDSLIQKYESDMKKQIVTTTYLNEEILRQKQELEKERETLMRLQSADLSLERFEKLQEIITELKSEISQLKQDKFAQFDRLEEVQQRANQLDIDNNELTIKMKQLKDLLEQRDETIAQIREKMLNNNADDDDEEKTTELTNLLSTVQENTIENNSEELLSNINHDIEKANQHMRDLHSDIEEKTRRIKELDALLNQEKDHCRELETKLKVVLELRERDAHLHIRQLGQTDAELRKARTDTERVRILQQQLDLKQKQLEDVQKCLVAEQSKYSEESSKLQHEMHENWMEVKRLNRELDGAKKECEGLRKQITKITSSERSSLEKTMHKPIPQHMNNTSRLSSEPEINNTSPSHPYQQGDNFRPIEHERNDSGAASPAEMLRIRPPMFPPSRVPFFPSPFMPPPMNPFMMAPRFPMPVGGPRGMLSPIAHLITNGSTGGSDANSFEIVDSVNITPNSTSYDAPLNGSAVSPVPNVDEDSAGAAVKPKKAKKSTKKKTKNSITNTSTTIQDV